MNYEHISKIIQIAGTDEHNVTNKVNAYIDPQYGWKILNILQLAESDSYSCPIFILGHIDSNPSEPAQNSYSKVWS